MLRSSLHLALVVALSTSSLPALAAAPTADADALYEEGRKDFNQGFFKSAIEKFEASYKKSKNPLILYNIGQTYKKLYDEEKKVDLLKSARSNLKEYVSAIEKDPGLGADPEEVKPVLADIDAELARVEAKPEPEGPTEPDTPAPTGRAEDPGRKLKLAGIGLMAGGGGLIVVGSILGGVFSVKGRSVGEKLNGANGLYEQLRDNGCGDEMSADEPLACDDIHTKISDARADGKKANVGAYTGFAVAGVGALLIIGGAVSYALGKRRTSENTARLRVVPEASWNYAGFVVQGRF